MWVKVKAASESVCSEGRGGFLDGWKWSEIVNVCIPRLPQIDEAAFMSLAG